MSVSRDDFLAEFFGHEEARLRTSGAGSRERRSPTVVKGDLLAEVRIGRGYSIRLVLKPDRPGLRRELDLRMWRDGAAMKARNLWFPADRLPGMIATLREGARRLPAALVEWTRQQTRTNADRASPDSPRGDAAAYADRLVQEAATGVSIAELKLGPSSSVRLTLTREQRGRHSLDLRVWRNGHPVANNGFWISPLGVAALVQALQAAEGNLPEFLSPAHRAGDAAEDQLAPIASAATVRR